MGEYQINTVNLTQGYLNQELLGLQSKVGLGMHYAWEGGENISRPDDSLSKRTRIR